MRRTLSWLLFRLCPGRYLNLGGGLGIPYRLDAKHMDLQRLNSHLQGFLEKNKVKDGGKGLSGLAV